MTSSNSRGQFKTFRRVSLSIILGLTGLFLSPHGLQVPYENLTISLPWSYIFPLIAALAYGWRYGLIAGLSGGALYPMLLWANNGYANLGNVLLLLNYLVIAGLASRKSSVLPFIKNRLTRLGILYLLGIVLFYLSFHVFFNRLLSLNPPFWSDKGNITQLTPFILNVFLVKDSINLLLVTVLADMLLRMNKVRLSLGLDYREYMSRNHHILFLAIGSSIVLWILLTFTRVILLPSDSIINQRDLLSLYVITTSSLVMGRIVVYFQERQNITRAFLKDSEERYRVLFENNMYPIVVSRLNGEIILMNQKTLEFFKANQANIKLYNTSDSWLDLSLRDQYIETIQKTGKAENWEVEIRNLEGTFKTVIISSNLIDYKNQPALLTIFNDISERKVMENELKESEEKYRSLFENANDGIFILCDNYMVDCNTTTAELFGLDREELLKFTPWDLSPEHQPDGQSSNEKGHVLLTEVLSGKRARFDWMHTRADGSLFEADVSLNRLNYNGKPAVMAIIRDQSEKARHDREVHLAAMKGEELERARLARELHDGLGPLLSTCKIYLHTAKEDTGRTALEHALSKINQIIDESLASLREISRNLSPHILRNFGLVQAIKSFTEKLDNRIEFQFNHNINPTTRYNEAIETSLYRILTELINNSLKYASATTIRIDLHEKSSSIELSYHDDGVGFDFDEKSRSNNGLGLSNIYSRVNAIGGTIKFITSANKGVEVFISVKLQ
jgi:PAS domain S-box-containing protein